MEKPSVFKVFYSWQSDTPQAHCRNLIGKALQAAADTLSSEEGIPYRIDIDRDTLNETGLCDIPATILAKIDAADAMVVDLTYVAQTQPKEGVSKFCSNPNVLFELGYAFRSMGHDRLVCVMNEEHGPRSNQIFDLHHRRHPIAFTSPHDTHTKAETVDTLATALVNALRPIILLHGPRSISGDGASRHASDRARIDSISRSLSRHGTNVATITCCLSPLLYQDRRWPDRGSLLAVIRRREVLDGMVQLPLNVNQARGMEWGIFCDTRSSNSDRWAMTYAGQFWCQFELPCAADRGVYIDPRRPSASSAAPSIDAYTMIYELSSAFAVMASLANEFYEGEILEILVKGEGFQGRLLGGTKWNLCEPTPPSISPGFSRYFKSSASEFASEWSTHCGDAAAEICDLFTTAGNEVPRNAIDRSLEAATQPKQIPPKQ